MTDKQEYNQIEPGLDDTQRLLQGVEDLPEGAFDLEDILAEFSGGGAEPAPLEKEPPVPEPPQEPEEGPSAEEPPAPEPEPEKGPGAAPSEEPPAGAASAFPGEDVLDEAFWEDPGPDDGKPSPEAPTKARPAAGAAKRAARPRRNSGRAALGEPSPPAASESGPEEPPQPEEAQNGAPSVEDIVASTVDAVQEEQAQRQAQLLRHLEKLRKKTNRGAPKKPPARRPPPDAAEDEPLPGEAAAWHRRRYKECRRSLRLASPVLVLLWLPWLLAQMGVEVPFFSVSMDNAALCVLVPQAVLCLLCWPVFRAATEGIRDRVWTACASSVLATVATLLDEMTLLLLPGRSDVAPLGGVAGAALVFSLWGLTSCHRGMMESLRTAAMGTPNCLVDCCDAGIAKGAGYLGGFYSRLSMEDTGSQWQRLLLPVLAAASVVFAVLSSVGQGRGQDFLWCWSAILCASVSLVFPMVFFVPFGRLAVRLARSGAAVAGQYGAAMLSASHRLVVTDGDLFPQGAAMLSGLKPYGEEREQVISYAASLAVQGGGLMGRLFEDLCRSEDIEYQPLEHFHVHDDNGLGGMIRGETVLLGTPAFMRRQAVRLPAVVPGKCPVCLAVDGRLTAVFTLRYMAVDTVSMALDALRRNGLQLVLAVRDGNLTSKFLHARFKVDIPAVVPELNERLALSDPEREAGEPNGLLYRDGLLPFVSLAAGSRRLCQTVLVGNLLSILGSVSGALLGFYLTFAGSYAVLTPMLLLTYLLLWVAPMLPLVWSVDKL